MKPMTSIASLLMAVALATPAFAGCDSDLAALDKRVASDAKTAIAASSSGQSVAAKRDEQAKEARDTHVPVQDVPKGPAAGSSEAHATAAAASAGSDRVMQAKVALNDAHVAKGKGDEAGCEAAVTKAKGLLAN